MEHDPVLDPWHMARALTLAEQGRGWVEPNPLVGCVVARGAEVIGEGWHRRFGGPHAEIEALGVAGARAQGATLYVTLEPCPHHGKTPPCVDAIVRAGIARVVAAMQDPFPQVAGKGAAALRAAGIDVTMGVREEESRALNAPYLKLVKDARPYTIAKWAMTWDGKIATRTGESKWISNAASREKTHALRGRMDVILIGIGSALRDDPLLTARPNGPRVAARVVLDSQARLPLDSQLVKTARSAPVLVASAATAPSDRVEALRRAGCEVYLGEEPTPREWLRGLWRELGTRRMTNVLVEGGAKVLGSLFDNDLIDEAHVFIAPKLIGGSAAPSPSSGEGAASLMAAARLREIRCERLEDDIYLIGRVERP